MRKKNGQELENVTFDELKPGQTASLTRTLTERDAQMIAGFSGVPHEGNGDDDMPGAFGYGMWSGALISTLLGTRLPGPGTVCLNQNLDFKKPVQAGDTIHAAVVVREKKEHKPVAVFDCICTNDAGEVAVSGTVTVLAPTRKIKRAAASLADMRLHYHDRCRDLMDSCVSQPPMRTAVVHPVTAVALQAALEAAEENLIRPVLIGPEARIRQAADEAGIDLAAFELIGTEHSHAAAARAVAMAGAGEVTAIMKGSLSTDELLAAIIPSAAGLRTERRISHAYLMDIPTYHKPLIITDAAINIAPTMDEKADICRNAIDLWRVITDEAAEPKLAALAAAEKVKSNIQASVDAACLSKMADRGQIAHAVIDGPLALDLAISPQAVQDKGLKSAVAGDADILLAPDIHSGNMIAKQLTFLGGANAAGIVLGARVPVILTSRADSLNTRLMSCALAVRMAEARCAGRIK